MYLFHIHFKIIEYFLIQESNKAHIGQCGSANKIQCKGCPDIVTH